MMEVIHSSKTLVPAGATDCHIPEDGIIHSEPTQIRNMLGMMSIVRSIIKPTVN
jgi:hypothetical protein